MRSAPRDKHTAGQQCKERRLDVTPYEIRDQRTLIEDRLVPRDARYACIASQALSGPGMLIKLIAWVA